MHTPPVILDFTNQLEFWKNSHVCARVCMCVRVCLPLTFSQMCDHLKSKIFGRLKMMEKNRQKCRSVISVIRLLCWGLKLYLLCKSAVGLLTIYLIVFVCNLIQGISLNYRLSGFTGKYFTKKLVSTYQTTFSNAFERTKIRLSLRENMNCDYG